MSLSSLAQAQLTNESEAGIASANGNTKTQTFNAKQLNDYKWDLNVVSFKARYLNASASGSETARYFMTGARYEKQFSNHFGLFLGETFEKDKFAGIEKRLMTDFGGKYRFIETDMTKLFSELGYRYMHEDRLDDSSAYNHYARLYTEWENKWNTSFSTKYWVEFLPNISEDKDWQLNTELSLQATLNSIFSLKSGVLLRYDHFPAPGIVYKTDTLFTTALVAKF
jgi:putative salt-induced outer membrane protein